MLKFDATADAGRLPVMRSLYVRIYLTVVAALLLFALVAHWLVQRNIDEERESLQTTVTERAAAWAALIEHSLPPADAPESVQRDALLDWSLRLRLPLALDNVQGRRIATSDLYLRHQQQFGSRHTLRMPLADGRALWIRRPMLHGGGPAGDSRRPPPHFFFNGVGLAAALLVLFVAVALGAYPVVRRLTRRLETLKQGVEAFGAGALSHRVPQEGRDEVAAVAASFNRAADRIEQLLRSHQSLLANASHELRSPLARLKMAVSMLEDAPAPQRNCLRAEIHTNIAELDALVEEVLLASRLDAQTQVEALDAVDLTALAAEEGARVAAELGTEADIPPIRGNERLLRRALRNLLENARRYGGDEVSLSLTKQPSWLELRVCDRGAGVPEAMRERIFEPFFRLPGHAEQAGGVGLGLSLVKQIAEQHGGQIICQSREGGGSCFVLRLPAAAV